jgi:hypothetical protein
MPFRFVIAHFDPPDPIPQWLCHKHSLTDSPLHYFAAQLQQYSSVRSRVDVLVRKSLHKGGLHVDHAKDFFPANIGTKIADFMGGFPVLLSTIWKFSWSKLGWSRALFSSVLFADGNCRLNSFIFRKFV